MEEKRTVGQKVKGHFKRHRNVYIAGGVGLTVGLSLGIMYGDKVKSGLSVLNINIGKDNSIVNNITQITQVSRSGHAGNVIRCNETGEEWSSQNKALKALKISNTKLKKHLDGITTDIDGKTFTKLGSFNADEQPIVS